MDCCNRRKGGNFTDWVPAWKDGVPPDAYDGVSGVLNFQMIWVLRAGGPSWRWRSANPKLAARNLRHADELAPCYSHDVLG